MKLFILFLCILAPFFTVAQTDTAFSFTISGKLKKMKDTATTVYLYYAMDNNRVTDSSDVQNGKYRLTGTINEPVLSRLSVKYKTGEAPVNMQKDMSILFLAPGRLKVTSIDSFSNIKVKGKGSSAHKDYKKFEALSKPFNDSMRALSDAYNQYRNEGNTAKMKEIEDQAGVLQKDIKENVFHSFIKAHPASPVSLLILQQYAGHDINIDEIEPLFDQLSPAVKAWPSALQFKERMDIAKRTSIGQMAADFTQDDTLGNPVSLSSLRGKYLLVDFWASWCGPCRAENPNVVNAFNKYKDKGFSVLGVSLDRPGAKASWLKAIHDDKLTWTHVSDLQFWNNAAAQLYGIQSIPQNLLLDPTGRIIGKNLRGQDLHNKLEEVLGK
jgi:peroxiredoxin